MPAHRIEFTVQDDLWFGIEAERGEVPRAAWIKQTLEKALSEEATSRRAGGLSSGPNEEDLRWAQNSARKHGFRASAGEEAKATYSDWPKGWKEPASAAYELPKIAPRRKR